MIRCAEHHARKNYRTAPSATGGYGIRPYSLNISNGSINWNLNEHQKFWHTKAITEKGGTKHELSRKQEH